MSDLRLDIRTNPVLRALRHKVFVRNAFYASLFITLLWLFYTVILPHTHISESFLASTSQPLSWDTRGKLVKRAFLHAYHGYEKYAAPHDEIKPLSSGFQDPFNGWGVTIFDSLDTMVLMELEDEYRRARGMIEQIKFDLPDHKFAPYFETIIRYLGGLLSAYALNKDPLLLKRAEELAHRLEPVFNTPTGLAVYGVNPSNGEIIGPEIGILAEIASLQLEYTYLSKVTGKKEYYDRAATVIGILSKADLRQTGGMLPIGWNLSSGHPADHKLSAGAQADSAHEYLLKQYLLTAKSDKTSLEMYIRATTHIISNLLFLSPTRNLLYVTDSSHPVHLERPKPSHRMEHLSCFLPGLFALGVQSLPWDQFDALGLNLDDLATHGNFGAAGEGYRRLSAYNLKDLHMWAAKGLAQTCWLMYADQPTGLSPDEIVFRSGENLQGALWMDVMDKWKSSGARRAPPGTADAASIVYTEAERLRGGIKGRDYALRRHDYALRPETIESLYLMWRITGETKWRERGWKIFESLEKHSKTLYGYASLKTVEKVPAHLEDNMPSYFLAETLKYLYLLCLDTNPIPLNSWIFNTEAHPLPVFKWTEEEKSKFGII